MKNWLVAIIIGNIGRLFNNPQLVYKLEDQLANSGPIKLLARTIVGFYQRGSWELKQLKGGLDQLEGDSLKNEEKGLMRRFKELSMDLKRKRSSSR